MVPITKVREANATFTRQNNSNLVLVFVGGTAGIGAATVKEMYQMIDHSVFYVLGRSRDKFEKQEQELEKVNKGRNQMIFLKCEVSLVKEVDWACKRIREEEKRIDMLCLSAGKVPFEGASCKLHPPLNLLAFIDDSSKTRKRVWSCVWHSLTILVSGSPPICFLFYGSLLMRGS